MYFGIFNLVEFGGFELFVLELLNGLEFFELFLRLCLEFMDVGFFFYDVGFEFI